MVELDQSLHQVDAERCFLEVSLLAVFGMISVKSLKRLETEYEGYLPGGHGLSFISDRQRQIYLYCKNIKDLNSNTFPFLSMKM